MVRSAICQSLWRGRTMPYVFPVRRNLKPAPCVMLPRVPTTHGPRPMLQLIDRRTALLVTRRSQGHSQAMSACKAFSGQESQSHNSRGFLTRDQSSTPNYKKNSQNS